MLDDNFGKILELRGMKLKEDGYFVEASEPGWERREEGVGGVAGGAGGEGQEEEQGEEGAEGADELRLSFFLGCSGSGQFFLFSELRLGKSWR